MPYFTNRGIMPLPATGNGLLPGLYGFWEFEETGTNTNDRQDATANNKDLSIQFNNVTNVSGVSAGTGQASYSSAGAAYAHTDEGALDFTGQWTACLWFKMDTVPGTSTGTSLIKKGAPIEANVVLNRFGSDRCSCSNNTDSVDFTTSVIPTNGAWFFIAAGVRSGNLFVSVNGAAALTTAVTTPPSHGAGNFVFMADGTAGVAVDQAGLWIGRGLSDPDIALLYNSGNGLAFTGLP